MKKILSVVLCIAMMLSLASFAAAEEHEEVTLTVGSIWSSESEATRAPFLQTIAEFEEAYPWIHLDIDWNEANAWKDKGETLALSDALPDVFYWNAGGILKTFVDSEDVMPLNDFIDDETMGRIEAGMLADMTFDGKIYQLPYTKAASALYCNTELFDKYGIKIPETWDELLDAVKQFRENGVTPMTTGGKDQWPTDMYTDIICLRFVGDEACRAAYYKTEGGTFKTDAWLEGVTAFKQLVDMGAFPDDVAALTRDEGEVPFFNGEVPMYVHGQWFSGSLSTEMQQKVKAVKFPVVPGKGTDNMWMGGAAEGFCVSSHTAHPQEAYIACEFFAEHLSKNGYISGAGLPAWKYDFSAYTDLNPVLQQILEASSTAESFLLWGNTALTGENSTLLNNTVYDLLCGDITPEQWCDEMETVFDK